MFVCNAKVNVCFSIEWAPVVLTIVLQCNNKDGEEYC